MPRVLSNNHPLSVLSPKNYRDLLEHARAEASSSGDDGIIYVLHLVDRGNVYKIGFSKKLKARLREHREAYGNIKLVHSVLVSGSGLAERCFHYALEHKRIDSAELFALDAADLEWLLSFKAVDGSKILWGMWFFRKEMKARRYPDRRFWLFYRQNIDGYEFLSQHYD